jgi:hypothetical protein
VQTVCTARQSSESNRHRFMRVPGGVVIQVITQIQVPTNWKESSNRRRKERPFVDFVDIVTPAAWKARRCNAYAVLQSNTISKPAYVCSVIEVDE